YHDNVHMKPRGIHAWAQADRLALAIGFYDNGMNFFKPRTYNQNSIDGITGVEFPLPAYLAALAGKIFGRDHISMLFRLISIIIGCTGLLFLFMAGYKRTKDFIYSMFTPLFVFCSPMFIYYTCSYLPDANAVGLLFVAFYYILDYLEHQSSRALLLSLFFLTLATLIKTSTGLYLLAFLGISAVQRLRQPKMFSRKHDLLF